MTSPESHPAPNPAEQASRTPEVLQDVYANVRITMNGVGAYIANKRMERAGDTMERMDHKDALYTHLGHVAAEGGILLRQNKGEGQSTLLTGVTHLGERPSPRSIGERILDKRLDAAAQKLQTARDAEHQAGRRYGRNSDGSHKNFGHESKRSINKRVKAAEKQAKREGRSAAEIRQVGIIERGKRVAAPTRSQRESVTKLNSEQKRVGRKIEQKHLRQWRHGRQQRAIGRIKTSHGFEDRRRESIAELQAQKARRREARS